MKLKPKLENYRKYNKPKTQLPNPIDHMFAHTYF